MKKDILIFSRYYLPGYKAGGPIESISLFVKKLKNYSNFSVFTSDRDFLDEFAYSNIKVNEWTERENTQIFYIDSNINSIFVYIKFLFSLKKFSTIYFTSLFDIKFTIIPIILIKFIYKDKKIIIAPRGELYDGALSIKKFKKVNFLFFSKLFNIFSDIIWHSTSSHESETIINNFDGAKLILAQNLIDDEISEIKRKFLNDKVKLVFFSRITEKKNLHYLLEILPHLNINYELDIFGPIDNIAYWHKCNSFIKKLNLEKRISYKGSIKKNEIFETLSIYDIFILPTLGENFGHVIFDALKSGLPVLISDNTPWKNLNKYNIGWTIPLIDQKNYIRIINDINNWSSKNRENFTQRVRSFLSSHSKIEQDIQNYRKLFSI